MDIFNAVSSQDTGYSAQPPTPTYTSDMPLFAPRNYNAYPRLEAPSTQIAHGVGKVVGLDSTMGERAGGAWDAFTGLLGLPQEAATRALTGNQYALPSEVPAVQALFGSSPVGGMAANILLDPLNLAGIPGIGKMLAGATELQQAAKTAKNLNEIQLLTRKSMLFPQLVDVQKVARKAGWGHIAPAYDDTSRMWTFDFESLPDQFRASAQADVEKAIQGFDITEVARFDPATGKRTYDPMKRISGEGKAGADVSGLKGMLKTAQMWIGTPEHVSTGAQSAVDLMRDVNQARSLYHDQVFGGITEAVPKGGLFTVFNSDPELLTAWDKPGSALGRAFTYELFNANGFAKDAEAMKAINDVGRQKFDRAVGQVQDLMREGLGKASGRIRGTFQDDIKKALDANVEIPLDPDFIKTMSGTKEVNPNTVNMKDALQFYFRYVSKRAFSDPAVEQLSKMVGLNFDEAAQKYLFNGAGSIKNLSRQEGEMLSEIVTAWRGSPTLMDNSLNEMILSSKDAIRSWGWGRDLAKKAAVGERIEEGGRLGFLGRQAEGLISGAEKSHYTAQKASNLGTARLYDSMLGGAIDTAFKNLGQTLNTITEFGFANTLKAAGAYLTPEWREALEARNVIDRTNSLYSEAFDQASRMKWADEPGRYEKFRRFIFGPFHVAENFNRGVNYIAAAQHHLGEGMRIGDALRNAEASVRELQFGYSVLDVSPFLRRNPAFRPVMQFMTYPMKQTELLGRMYAAGGGPSAGMKNPLVRYLVNTGFAVGYGAHLGLDVSKMFIAGLLDVQAGAGPLAEAVGETAAAGGELVQRLWSGGDPEADSPSTAWRQFGKVVRYWVPGGRYAGKAVKEGLESGLIEGLFSKDLNARTALTDNPGLRPLFDFFNVRPDPGVDPLDRFARMIGVRTLRDENRQDLMQFLKQFSRRLNEAQSQINETAAMGGDVGAIREKWGDKIETDFRRQLSRYNVPMDVVLDELKPSLSPKQAAKRRAEVESGNVDRLTKTLPKKVKQRFVIPEGY